jgi:hypothetical protein
LGLDHPGVVCMDAAAPETESHGVTARFASSENPGILLL